MAESPVTPALLPRLIAEVFGTFLLVFAVIGTALYSSSNTGYLGVALAVGLAVIAGAYSVGSISGGHFNPAVTLGVAVAGRMLWKDVLPYIVAQIVGGAVSSTLLFAIAAGGPAGFLAKAQAGGFASNGFGAHSPGGFGLVSVILVEVVLTALFLWVILGVTAPGSTTPGFAPLAIGLTLTAIHLVAIPVSNASVNPARSIATAIYGGPDALAQLWVFLVAPLVGALIAGASYKALFARKA
ncbi:aquaporin Z [Galbitalea soli]|uniref:Aquaporin Z n=1 Tax=Galbitalea soli TaxID=1268042 RepID=A0A7C9PMC6_9MICO|nr:aquaporin Z [Galbitalea soli]NEM90832.1 aquaporin Z [Galbitalea soli]NYJ31552.1 aquaporin Z [Galbitalea soli]